MLSDTPRQKHMQMSDSSVYYSRRALRHTKKTLKGMKLKPLKPCNHQAAADNHGRHDFQKLVLKHFYGVAVKLYSCLGKTLTVLSDYLFHFTVRQKNFVDYTAGGEISSQRGLNNKMKSGESENKRRGADERSVFVYPTARRVRRKSAAGTTANVQTEKAG